MATDTEVKALGEAKAVIGRLIAGIEGHHATSACDDSGIWALANREYKALDTIRDAITEATASRYQKRHYEDVAALLGHEYAALPVTATPAEFLNGYGNWSLTEAEMSAVKTVSRLMVGFADLFAADNPPECLFGVIGGFDRKRFLKACGLESEG